MSRENPQGNPPSGDDEAESGLTTALKVGAVGLGVAVAVKLAYDAGASSQQPPAPITNNYYVNVPTPPCPTAPPPRGYPQRPPPYSRHPPPTSDDPQPPPKGSGYPG